MWKSNGPRIKKDLSKVTVLSLSSFNRYTALAAGNAHSRICIPDALLSAPDKIILFHTSICSKVNPLGTHVSCDGYSVFPRRERSKTRKSENIGFTYCTISPFARRRRLPASACFPHKGSSSFSTSSNVISTFCFASRDGPPRHSLMFYAADI